MWIARDKDGRLYLYIEKPELNRFGRWDDHHTASAYLIVDIETLKEIEYDQFPEVTFENSPKELKIK